ncbi:MAG: rod shape-determining protein MreC, partial [Candidatus Aminicenantales bacterium]
AVCDRNGNVIGRTVDPVTEGESRIQLITDADSGISVISSGQDRIVGILSGDSLGMCRMKFVLATTAGGAEGEDLFTTGFDKIYPPGLRVGTVVRVGNDATLFKAIWVRPAFSFADLDTVAIIKDQVQELY